jgi:hypothetical protein
MGTRLVNVRLDEERLRKARRLGERGLALSDLVRAAIDEQFDALGRERTRGDVKAILARIFDEHPDPPGLPVRAYDVHDRKAARQAIRRGLGRKRR